MYSCYFTFFVFSSAMDILRNEDCSRNTVSYWLLDKNAVFFDVIIWAVSTQKHCFPQIRSTNYHTISERLISRQKKGGAANRQKGKQHPLKTYTSVQFSAVKRAGISPKETIAACVAVGDGSLNEFGVSISETC